MQPARIAELLAPFLGNAHDQQLTPNDLQHISTYIDILQRWNARINLTAIRDPEQIVTRHFGESLFAARSLFPQRGHEATDQSSERGRAVLDGRVGGQSMTGALAPEGSESSVPSVSSALKKTLADVGSGAGFPGIPIKLWQPNLAVTLIESNQKKATFLGEVVRVLTLTDVNILTARAESLTPAAFKAVTLRAVERFETILPIAARLVAPEGRLALLIASAQLSLAHSVLDQIGGFPARRRSTHPMPVSRSRTLFIAERSMQSASHG